MRFEVQPAARSTKSWGVWDTVLQSWRRLPTGMFYSERLSAVEGTCVQWNAAEAERMPSYQERAEAAELEAQAYRAKMHQQARIAKRKQAWINRGIAEGWIRPPTKEEPRG